MSEQSINCASRPTLRDLVNRVVPLVKASWFNLGLQLLDPKYDSELNAFEADTRNDAATSCRKMFDKWLSTDELASWDKLIKALRIVQLNNVASDIEQLLLQKKCSKASETQQLCSEQLDNETQQLDNFKTNKPQSRIVLGTCIEKFEDDDVVGAFACLFNKLGILFGEVNFTQLKRACIQRGTLLPDDFKQKMKAAIKLDDLLDVLDNPLYCNWLNIRVLKRITRSIESDIPEAKKLIQSYENDVYSRKVSDVMKYFDTRCFNPSHVSLVKAKINRSFESLTVAEVIMYCQELESNMGVHAGSVTATECEPGCLQITCVIPIHCALHAYETAKINFLKFRKSHIQYIEIKSFSKILALNSSIRLDRATLGSKDTSQVISHCYTFLENYMDADSVSHMMLCEHLIIDDDYEAITAAPNDNKMNTLLLQYVRSMNANQLSRFCDILKSIEAHNIIGVCSSTFFQEALLRLSTNMRVSASNEALVLSIEHMKISEVNVVFYDLIDYLYLHLSAMERFPFDLVGKCCDIYPKFTDQLLKKTGNCTSLYLLKIYLLSIITWLDHSVLKDLVVASGSADAHDLLNLFDSKLESFSSQSISTFPVLSPSQLMIPLDDSGYTLLAVKFCSLSEDIAIRSTIVLQDVIDIKLLMIHEWGVSSHEIHSMQLVAVHTKLGFLYWVIPKCLVKVVKSNLVHYWNSRIVMMAVLPENFYDLENNNEKHKGPFSSLNFLWQDDNEEQKSAHATQLCYENSEIVSRVKLLEMENKQLKQEHVKMCAKRFAEKKAEDQMQPSLVKQSMISDDVAISHKSDKSNRSQIKSSSGIKIHQLMNIVPFIQEKWSLIGIRLKLSSDQLDDIWQKAIKQQIPSESKNTFCCIKMLTSWYEASDDISVDAIMMAIDVGLRAKISNIETALTSEYMGIDYGAEKSVTSSPEELVLPYVNMKTKFCLELSKSQHSISDVLMYLKICKINLEILEGIHDFPELLESFERHAFLNKADLSWLKNIADHTHCVKATEAIEEYESLLMADKIPWYSSQPKGTYLVGKTDKMPEDVTIKDASNAKLAASRIVNIKDSDSVLGFSEVGSVIFYWRLVNEAIKIKIPQVSNASLIKECKFAYLTHVGIMTNGNLNLATIDEIDHGLQFGKNNHAFHYEDLEIAALRNNKKLVEEWLASGDVKDGWQGSLLRQAAYHRCVDVVECIISYENSSDILNYADTDGKAPLHYAAEGSKRTDTDLVALACDLFNIIGYLFKNGADPTCKSKAGMTPKEIAVEHKFKALFEILENVWLKKPVSGKVDSYEKICWHKEILQWAVENAYEEIVICILRMNLIGLVDPDQPCTTMIQPHQQIGDQDSNTMEFLLRTTEELYANSFIHTAANMGNVNMLKAFIICSGQSLNVAINRRWKQMLQSVVSNEESQSGQTPLSLALSHDSYHDIITALAELQVGNKSITQIDLSNSMTESLPKELFNFHSIINLNISKNYLKQLPFAQLASNLRPGQLSDLNVSSNQLSSLPVEIFYLPNLKNLNASYNPLTSLPDMWWLSKSLIKLNVSNTQLGELCSWKDADQNFFKERGRLASNTSNSSPTLLQRSNSLDRRSCLLKELNVSFSSLSSFPRYLACYFPNLEHLNVSNNNITSCCAVNEIPAFLEDLDISNNKLQSEECAIFSLLPNTNCCYLNTEVESSLKCTHMRHTKLLKLRNLNLSNNEKLQKISMHIPTTTTDSLKRDFLYCPKLAKLVISNCGLLQAPEFLDKMDRIYHLDISKNHDMKIPHEVHNLSNLMTFVYDGLKDQIAANLDQFSTVKEQQMFLMQKDATCAPSMKLMFVGLSGRGKTTLLNSLRFAGKVKTRPITIRERLDSGSNMEFSEEIRSTIGIDQELWVYAKDMDTGDSGNSNVGIAFYAWDFAGQEEYSAAHQCFVTENSLYVLCWRACDKSEGILELKDWLLTIKARAKSAAVVIVGTHIDKIKGFGPRSTASLVKSIKDMYSNEHDYPPIKAIKFISCVLQFEGTIKNLRDTLYDIASETKLSLGSRRYEQKLMDMMIPNKYLELQKKIIAEGANFRLHKERNGPPILSWNQMLKIGGDCGFEEDELAVAIKYLKNQGSLMHFDSLALQDYYFLDPQWLCDLFAHVISTEYNYTFVSQGGKGDRHALEASLNEKFCISPQSMEPIIMLLNKFELAIPLDQTTFLIPSLLQNEEVPDVVNRVYGFSDNRAHTIGHANKISNQSEESMSSFNSLTPNRRRAGTAYFPSVIAHYRVDKQITLYPKGMCFRRVFIADHIPANFWPRLIARFLSSAHTFHAIICENCAPGIQCQNLVQIGYATIGALKCGWSYGKNYITLCLGEDILLCVNALNSYDNNKSSGQRKKEKTSKVEKVHIYYSNKDFTLVNIHNGFEVTIPDYSVSSQSSPNEPEHDSELMSAQVLSRVLEIVDEVFRDWFDGLSDRGIYSDNYLVHFVPCPFCYDGKKLADADNSASCKFTKRKIAVGLSIKYCLLQARTSDHVNCPDCGELSFKDYAPDLVFEDKKFQKIDPRQLRISKHPLGEGGYGAVYKAVFLTDPPQDVALKCFDRGLNEAKTITLEDLSQTYADVRMEFNKLVSIDHQYIVKCIGFSAICMAFVLELASHGSLKTVMDNYKSSGYHLCPNSLIDTIRQVSVALNYLHTEKMIAHYDIKPANILVFRYPPAGHNCFNKTDSDFLCRSCKADHNDRVEVKLADLGVSAFVGPGGFRRRPATPGHTAPEAIKYGGKESLMEKVDIFSLGITLFELMTLRFLPPVEMNPFDFDSDIRDGIRPPFYEEDPNYPAILKELVFKCWAQDYAARPSAEEIVSMLKSVDCLKLSNVLDTEIPFSAVSTALVVSVDDKQSLWLAHSIDNQHKVTVYELSEDLSSTSFSKSKSFDVDGSVQIMCQAGMQVWMAFDNGGLKAINVQSFRTDNQIRDLETRDGLIQIVNLSDRNDSTALALAYKSGVVVLVKSYYKFPEGIEVKSFGLDVLSKLQNKLTTVKLTSSQLCATEAHKSRVWCGCDNGAIEVISFNDDTFEVQLFNAHDSSPDIPQDTSIIQLRFSASATDHMMYALHSCGRVVSCWSVSERPVLNTVINLTELISSPVNLIIPIENTLILADASGKVHELNLNHTIKEKYLSCKQLPSYHQSNTMIHLFCLHGKMTPQGFLFSIGNSLPDKRSEYVNIFDILCPSSLPCIVLLGLRAGYNFFQAEGIASTSLYFTTWVFPNTPTK